jgi:hypothetical protein
MPAGSQGQQAGRGLAGRAGDHADPAGGHGHSGRRTHWREHNQRDCMRTGARGARLRACTQPVRAGARGLCLPVTAWATSGAGARAVPARRAPAGPWPLRRR